MVKESKLSISTTPNIFNKLYLGKNIINNNNYTKNNSQRQFKNKTKNKRLHIFFSKVKNLPSWAHKNIGNFYFLPPKTFS